MELAFALILTLRWLGDALLIFEHEIHTGLINYLVTKLEFIGWYRFWICLNQTLKNLMNLTLSAITLGYVIGKGYFKPEASQKLLCQKRRKSKNTTWLISNFFDSTHLWHYFVEFYGESQVYTIFFLLFPTLTLLLV